MTIADSPVQSYFKGSFISSWDAETQKIFSGRMSKCIESLVSGEKRGRTGREGEGERHSCACPMGGWNSGAS